MNRSRSALTLALAWMLPELAHALMAGVAPDSPAARIDPNAAASTWSSAVSVIVAGSAYSGVVVAPSHVLTAAHVAGGAQPAAITVQVNSQPAPVVLAVSAVTSFPSASFPYDDLTLLTLAAPVPAEVAIRPVLTSSLPSRQTLTLVGYGASGHGDAGPTVGGSASVKRRGTAVADAVQSAIDSSGRTSLFYLFDFDGPSGNGAMGGSTLGNSFETGLASGDSGSPAFAEINGQLWLVGINTFVAPGSGSGPADYRFGTIGGGMLLSDPRFVSWLTSQTQGTLGMPADAAVGDIPIPSWALAGLGGLLGGQLFWLRPGRAPSGRRRWSLGSGD